VEDISWASRASACCPTTCDRADNKLSQSVIMNYIFRARHVLSCRSADLCSDPDAWSVASSRRTTEGRSEVPGC